MEVVMTAMVVAGRPITSQDHEETEGLEGTVGILVGQASGQTTALASVPTLARTVLLTTSDAVPGAATGTQAIGTRRPMAGPSVGLVPALRVGGVADGRGLRGSTD